MEAAQQILDRVIITPPLSKTVRSRQQIAAGAEYTMTIPGLSRRRLQRAGFAARRTELSAKLIAESGWRCQRARSPAATSAARSRARRRR